MDGWMDVCVVGIGHVDDGGCADCCFVKTNCWVASLPSPPTIPPTTIPNSLDRFIARVAALLDLAHTVLSFAKLAKARLFVCVPCVLWTRTHTYTHTYTHTHTHATQVEVGGSKGKGVTAAVKQVHEDFQARGFKRVI